MTFTEAETRAKLIDEKLRLAGWRGYPGGGVHQNSHLQSGLGKIFLPWFSFSHCNYPRVSKTPAPYARH